MPASTYRPGLYNSMLNVGLKHGGITGFIGGLTESLNHMLDEQDQAKRQKQVQDAEAARQKASEDAANARQNRGIAAGQESDVNKANIAAGVEEQKAAAIQRKIDADKPLRSQIDQLIQQSQGSLDDPVAAHTYLNQADLLSGNLSKETLDAYPRYGKINDNLKSLADEIRQSKKDSAPKALTPSEIEVQQKMEAAKQLFQVHKTGVPKDDAALWLAILHDPASVAAGYMEGKSNLQDESSPDPNAIPSSLNKPLTPDLKTQSAEGFGIPGKPQIYTPAGQGLRRGYDLIGGTPPALGAGFQQSMLGSKSSTRRFEAEIASMASTLLKQPEYKTIKDDTERHTKAMHDAEVMVREMYAPKPKVIKKKTVHERIMESIKGSAGGPTDKTPDEISQELDQTIPDWRTLIDTDTFAEAIDSSYYDGASEDLKNMAMVQ